MLHHDDAVGKAIDLVPVVRDEDGRLAELAQRLVQLPLEAEAQMLVERGKRLVQQQDLRVGDEDTRQRDALLLAAGQLRGIVPGQRLELEALHQPFGQRLALGFIALAPRARADVLCDRHVREQGVILEHQARPPLLRREVDVLFGVKERHTVDDDAAPVGPLDARDALERHALAAAGRAEQRENFIFRLKGDLQMEVAEALFQIYKHRHLSVLLSRAAPRAFPACSP